MKKIKKTVAMIICIIMCISVAISYIQPDIDFLENPSELESTLLNIPIKIYAKITNIISPVESNRIKQSCKALYQDIYNALVYNDNFHEKGIVTRVVDGDTLVVLVNGIEEKIRLIGVNTPESVGKYIDNPQYYGKEASKFTKQQLLGKHVYLESDRGPTDRFGRKLRYVWLKNPDSANLKEDLFNSVLLQRGYGEVMIISPNDKYAELFKGFEKMAKLKSLGMWSK